MKTGLFFGSFNPIHIGHLAIANYMVEYTDLNQLWFIISPQNPFKNKRSLLNDYDRFELVEKAIGDDPAFRVSNIEFRLPQPSYTINTLTYLKERHPHDQFVLILGTDNLETFHKWKNSEEILKYHELYIYPRPGSDGGNLINHKKVRMVHAPLIEISSEFIRNAIREDKNVRYFLPEKVYRYILEMHFYEK